MPNLSELLPKNVSPVAVRRAPSVNWRLLYEALPAIRGEVSDPAARRELASELMGGVLAAEYTAWISFDSAGQVAFDAEKVAPALSASELRVAAVDEVRKALATDAAVFTPGDQGRHVAAVRVCDGERPGGLAVVVPAGLDPAAAVAALQLTAAAIFGRPPANSAGTPSIVVGPTVATPAAESAAATDDNGSTVAVALELTVRLSEAADAKAAAKSISDLVRRQLKAEHVAVGLVKRAGTTVEATALSDVAELDPKSDAAQLLADCLIESLPQTALVTWSRESEFNPTGLGKWRLLADRWQTSELAAVRFVDRKGEAVAVCLIGSTTPIGDDAERFVTLAGQLAGPMLRMLERAGYGRRLHEIRRRIPTWFRGRNAWLVAAAIALPLVYPWCARTTCPVMLEPIAHRLIAAPFEGVFDHSLVMPGDRVEVGQVLGRMDGRELRAKLAACEADLNRAGKSRDVNLAAGKLAGTQIDRLEMERLEHERAVLVRRLAQLEIRSPIAGIVVTGDLRRYEAATVKVGQSLYEIAPLDRLTAELSIPEEDLEQVFDGADVTIRLDAVSAGTFDGQIERIRPRGEMRDNRQVFVAEVDVSNGGENLRPGMKGSATVIGPRAPGIWLLVRKPWHATLRFVGW
jgi:hypothetical protein